MDNHARRLASAAAAVALAMALIGYAGRASSTDSQDAAATPAVIGSVQPLKALGDFASINDRAERSAALFTEAARVVQSPRCLNCHPATRTPTQGDDMHPHRPLVVGGNAGVGAAGLHCKACHQSQNFDTRGASPATVPGHPLWHLAPASMAWQGKSTTEICRQLKDPALNGGRTLAMIHEHMMHDGLVGWAWRPGEGREPAPGTQHGFGELIGAWIETGAACPTG